MKKYKSPKVSEFSYHPYPVCQYQFQNFSGNFSSIGLNSNQECAVQENASAFATCLAGEADYTGFKIVILENGSPLETVTLENSGGFPDCELSISDSSGECQEGDTFVLCHDFSTVFDPTPTQSPYTFELLDSDNNTLATSEPCPASIT